MEGEEAERDVPPALSLRRLLRGVLLMICIVAEQKFEQAVVLIDAFLPSLVPQGEGGALDFYREQLQ